MPHTPNVPWPDREPETLLLTAYRSRGQWHLLIQEHNNTVAGALRPHYVYTVALWQGGKEGLPTNRDVLLALQDGLTRLLNPMTAEGATVRQDR